MYHYSVARVLICTSVNVVYIPALQHQLKKKQIFINRLISLVVGGAENAGVENEGVEYVRWWGWRVKG